ncbi:MAG TPA: hypothetical protein VK680_01235 [Solirubrobacteraceae bacterium]|nr:hypothetical protein [Solirubrobacteraceae bacterium]
MSCPAAIAGTERKSGEPELPGWELVANSYPTNFVHGVDAEREITVEAGTFTLTFEEQTTATIASGATGQEVQAALEALPSIGTGNVSVTQKGGSPSSYVVTFRGLLGNMKVGELGASGASVSEMAEGSSSGTIGIDVFNIGAGSTEGTITITDTLPSGVKAKEAGEVQISGGRLGIDPLIKHELWDCSGNGPSSGVAGATTVTCTNDPEHLPSFAGGGGTPTSDAYETFANPQPVLGIAVEAESNGDEPQHTSCAGHSAFCNRVEIAGGGAPASASTEDPITISSRSAPGGLVSADAWFSKADGEVDTQAGSHPYTATFVYNLATALNAEKEAYRPGGELRDIDVRLPAGFVGNLHDMPQCAAIELRGERCPPSSMVGNLAVEGSFLPLERRIFNMAPPAGTPGELAFILEGVPVYISFSVASGSDYAVVSHVRNIKQAETYQAIVTLWGSPGAASHARWRGVEGGCTEQEMNEVRGAENGHIDYCTRPQEPTSSQLFTLPTSCATPGTIAFHELASWQLPDETSEIAVSTHGADGTPAGLTGCEALEFEPAITTSLGTAATDTPTGITARVTPPLGGLEEQGTLGTADLKDARVTLPEGLVINPGQAAGLTACGPGEDALTTDEEREHGEEDDEAPSCPSSSKVGTVTIKTPLIESAIEKQLEGNVYILQSNPPDVKILVAASADGVNLKVVGDVHLNEETGRVETIFENTPELPFSDFELNFDGGVKAALVSPSQCGLYTTSADFTPWTSPLMPDLITDASFSLTEGPNGGPCASPGFAPSLVAGTSRDQAGGFATFTTLLRRGDGQQRVETLSFTSPAGLAGMISSVPLCPEAQAADGSCPQSSQIGHAITQSGPGAAPLTIPQPGDPEAPIYLTGPYEGAPYGLSIVTPVIAGPFNLGTVVTRARIEVDPHTAQVTVTTDPLPRIVKGVPTDLRSIYAVIDRPGFFFNPTNCEAQQFTGTATSVGDAATAPLASRFAVEGCRGLTFAPKFSASTQGNATFNRNGASLKVNISTNEGAQSNPAAATEANIRKVNVQLPLELPSRLETLQRACTEKQFAANPADCPEASDVGTATATTPVLPGKLTGPAYLVSHGGAAFPNLEIILQGDGITIVLSGITDIKKLNGKEVTFSRFESVPDAPVTSFELNLPERRYSALSGFELCTPKTVTRTKTTMVRRRGRRVQVNRRVTEHVAAPLEMPTTITAQNGAVFTQNTKIAVSGCKAPKAKAKKASKPNRRAKRRG